MKAFTQDKLMLSTFDRRPLLSCFLIALVGILSLASLTGCNRDQITSYRIPKEKPVETMAADPAPGSPPSEVHWVTPSGWEEVSVSPGGMRAGAFKIATNGATAEVSITPLPGVAGIELQSVNMWRQALGLTPFGPDEFAKNAETAAVGNLQGSLFDLSGRTENSTNRNRTIGAIAKQNGSLWFFKLTGDDQLVAAQKTKFEQFLKSISFSQVDEAKVAAAPTGRKPMSTNAKHTPVPAGNHAAWKLPEGWVEQSASSMVLASFLASGKTGKAEVSVSMFPGDVGGVLANVNRWRGQLGLSPISESDLPQATSQVDLGSSKGVLVDMTGQNVRTGSAARMLAAIVPRDGNTWFYKMMGDAAVITEQKQAFLEFAASAH